MKAQSINNILKHKYGKDKAIKPNPKSQFDGNYNFCGSYDKKEFDCYKKKKEEKNKGNGNVQNSKGNKNIKVRFIAGLYSMTYSFLTNWIVNSDTKYRN